MRLSLLAVLGAMALAPATASAATTITVKEGTDAALSAGHECGSGEGCSLRGAVELADNSGGETTIDVPAGEYALTEGELSVEDGADVTIHGAGAAATIIEQNTPNSGVIGVEGGGSLTLQGVTVRGGEEFIGGGLYAGRDGALAVEQSTVTGNEAAVGGGIFGQQGSSVSVTESTIAGNEAETGGGIAMETSQCELQVAATRPTARTSHASGRAPAAQPLPFASGLTVSRSTIEGNHAVGGDGGGIYYGPSCFAVPESKPVASVRPLSLVEEEGGLTIEQSTIAGNSAGSSEVFGVGGGVYEETLLVADPIVDSTITGNSASFTAGGLADGSGETVLVNDTVTDNKTLELVESGSRLAVPRTGRAWSATRSSASADAPSISLGPATNIAAEPFNEEARIELRNTIVADTSGEGENCEGTVESLVEGAAYNLDYPSTTQEEASVDTCGMSKADGDLVNVNPQLDPSGLAANGGPTQTIALLSSSPAIGVLPIAGDCEDEGDGPALPNGEGKAVPVDQRGEPRPGIPGAGCDVGAYEYQKPGEEPVKKEPAKEEAKTATTSTPAAAAAVQAVKISSPVCASKRKFTIHIQNVKQFGIVSVVIAIDGKHKRTISGRRLATGVDLVGLPKGTFTVSIVARTRSGQTLHGKRVYHTCHTRLPGHARLRL